eukprot:CAMPEP_0201546352 /NCGR_PEP_ID=MMETSP0173_2-20130828/2654_1 /ASSEMBLY_ACC=CAM_ASM_000268 /TAXON_ID=218659 /ORGANISM="Vexillifera sp., Strain DIVA3 564/2" /LENGTH=136 /DNA_ID=CAMNT_0047954987 /DNA_START=396 /DNA_END=806 /DNA_ORIENTATION=+
MAARFFLATADNARLVSENIEWIRGANETDLCTYTGNHHLAWRVPLTNPTYLLPSNFIHFFMMFAPFFALEMSNWIHGGVLLLTGPVLAAFITDNLHEQASIWCFFSIIQVTLGSIVLARVASKAHQHRKNSKKSN